jgi:predicted ABC-type ATPase
MHLERVKARADAGGHAASETTLRRIYDSSLTNLAEAVSEMDVLWIYDNSPVGGPPVLLAEAQNSTILFLKDDPPDWLALALDLKLTDGDG